MGTQIDLDAYHANGFALVRNVFDTDTLGDHQRETDALLERPSRSGRAPDATWKLSLIHN
jgi:hypothetical protein